MVWLGREKEWPTVLYLPLNLHHTWRGKSVSGVFLCRTWMSSFDQCLIERRRRVVFRGDAGPLSFHRSSTLAPVPSCKLLPFTQGPIDRSGQVAHSSLPSMSQRQDAGAAHRVTEAACEMDSSYITLVKRLVRAHGCLGQEGQIYGTAPLLVFKDLSVYTWCHVEGKDWWRHRKPRIKNKKQQAFDGKRKYPSFEDQKLKYNQKQSSNQ